MRVQWQRARYETTAHLIVVGDLVVLCGQRMVESVPHVIAADAVANMACPDCSAIITEAAESLGVVSHA